MSNETVGYQLPVVGGTAVQPKVYNRQLMTDTDIIEELSLWISTN